MGGYCISEPATWNSAKQAEYRDNHILLDIIQETKEKSKPARRQRGPPRKLCIPS